MYQIYIEDVQDDIAFVEAQATYGAISESISSIQSNMLYAESISFGAMFSVSKIIHLVLSLISKLAFILKKLVVVIVGIILKKVASIYLNKSSGGYSSMLASTMKKGDVIKIPVEIVDDEVMKGIESVVPNNILAETLTALSKEKPAAISDSFIKTNMYDASVAKEDMHKFINRGDYSSTRSAMFNLLFVSLNAKLESMMEISDNSENIINSIAEYRKFINTLVLTKSNASGFTDKLIYFSYKDSYDFLRKVAENDKDVKPFKTMKDLAQKDMQAFSKIKFFDNATLESIYIDLYNSLTGTRVSTAIDAVELVNQFIVDIMANGLELTGLIGDYFEASYKNLYIVNSTESIHELQSSLSMYFDALSPGNPFRNKRKSMSRDMVSKKLDFSSSLVIDYSTCFFFSKILAIHDSNIRERLHAYIELSVHGGIKNKNAIERLSNIANTMNRIQSDNKIISVNNSKDITMKLMEYRYDSRYTNLFVIPSKLRAEKEVNGFPTFQYYVTSNFLYKCSVHKDALKDAISRVSQDASTQIKNVKREQEKLNKIDDNSPNAIQKSALSDVCSTVTSLLNIVQNGTAVAHTLSMLHYNTINNKLVDLYVANYKLIIESMMTHIADKMTRARQNTI